MENNEFEEKLLLLAIVFFVTILSCNYMLTYGVLTNTVSISYFINLIICIIGGILAYKIIKL